MVVDYGSKHEHNHEISTVASAVLETLPKSSTMTTDRDISTLKWSFAGLLVTVFFQVVVVWYSGSAALLADMIHSFAVAATAIPLFIAFSLARWKPTGRLSYGFGRVGDLAGILIVLTILASAVIAGYISIQRIIFPQPVINLWAVAVAAVIGFAGKGGVALFRIKAGREMGSSALIADGHHARTDGLTSLVVLLGVTGVWLGFPLADPIVGLVITLMILKIVWDAANLVSMRLLVGGEPAVVDDIIRLAKKTSGVAGVGDVRLLWLGYRMHTEVSISVDPTLGVAEAYDIAEHTREQLLQGVRHLSSATVHLRPIETKHEKRIDPSVNRSQEIA